MSTAPVSPTCQQRDTEASKMSAFCWLLLAVYAASRFLQVFPLGTPMVIVVALHVLPPAIFAFAHGTRRYGWRGMSLFFVLVLVIGNIFENVGIRTGFPFGQYFFTDRMGPKLLAVPVLLGLAYVGMAYLSWALARLILRDVQSRGVSRIVAVPVLASLGMVAWDVSQDPVWATILHLWIWVRGGMYFGVPLTNFAGWFLTVYVIFQCFALCVRGNARPAGALTRAYWRQAVVFYVTSAAGNLLLVIPRPGLLLATDGAGTNWRVADITAGCAVATIIAMGSFAVLAWRRSSAAEET